MNMKKPRLNENFISRIWEEQKYYSGLLTTDNETVEIIDYGTKNPDAGPDYKDAKVKIGEVIYSGSIEIHSTLKDWDLHNHKGDNKYNDVVLHVVFYRDEFEDDFTFPKVKKARSIHTVILSEFLTGSVHDIWKDIINNPSPAFKLPCFPQNRSVPCDIKTGWLEDLSIERLKYKTEKISSGLDHTAGDIRNSGIWEQILFEYICEALGYSKNKVQFLKLSSKIDLKQISELKLDQLQTEALMFGLSGFLYDLRFRDEYCEKMKSEWSKLRNFVKAEPMDKSEWNFFRLRPPNFPTLRIAYASGILNEIIYNDLFRDIIRIFEESESAKKEIMSRFSEVTVSDYWNSHYRFGKESKSKVNLIGNERINDIITNLLLPMVFLYSKKFDKKNLENRILFYYKKEKVKKDLNEVIRVMQTQLDLKAHTLATSQALIHLHNFYCMKGKCNECEIGKEVFRNDAVHEPLRIILY